MAADIAGSADAGAGRTIRDARAPRRTRLTEKAPARAEDKAQILANITATGDGGGVAAAVAVTSRVVVRHAVQAAATLGSGAPGAPGVDRRPFHRAVLRRRRHADPLARRTVPGRRQHLLGASRGPHDESQTD